MCGCLHQGEECQGIKHNRHECGENTDEQVSLQREVNLLKKNEYVSSSAALRRVGKVLKDFHLH